MLNSIYTAISGLQAEQQALDVTGNNIANVNTTGYKASSTEFEDALSQTLGTSSTSITNQVGLGVVVGGTATNLTQGSQQATGQTSDLMIQGDGYFPVSVNGTTEYTRNGAFTLNQAGNFVTADGAKLEDANGNVIALPQLLNSSTYSSYTINASGQIQGVGSGGTTTLAQIGLANFANPEALLKGGNSEYLATANSGAAVVGAPGANGTGGLLSGYLEMSNVDLTQELTNLIVAQRGFQANSKVVTTSDQVLQTLVQMVN